MSSSVHFPLTFAGSARRAGGDRRQRQAARNRRSIIHRTPEKNRTGASPAEIDPGFPMAPDFVILFILRRRPGCSSGFWRAGGVNPSVLCPPPSWTGGGDTPPKRSRDVGKLHCGGDQEG